MRRGPGDALLHQDRTGEIAAIGVSRGGIFGAGEFEERGRGGLLQREHGVAGAERVFHLDWTQSGGAVIGRQHVDLAGADERDGGRLSVDGDADAVEGGGQHTVLEIGVAPGTGGGGEQRAEDGNPGAGSDRLTAAGGVDHSARRDGGLLRRRLEGVRHGNGDEAVGMPSTVSLRLPVYDARDQIFGGDRDSERLRSEGRRGSDSKPFAVGRGGDRRLKEPVSEGRQP